METKTCKQCGELKPIEQFRKYYGGRKGTYNTCKTCEKINARAKYLRSKEELTAVEQTELNKIYRLQDIQREVGLQPPSTFSGRSIPLVDSLDEMIGKYKDMATVASVDAGIPQAICHELSQWLVEPLVEEPDYYLEDVYEYLCKKYRPQLRIDTATMQPVYDDTYKKVLEQVLERFYEYEEHYWDKED